ncbi:MAG: TIGR02757 family protein [Vulcanimicrobiota bacterium]
MTNSHFASLKTKLDEISHHLDFEDRIQNDPVQFPRRFVDRKDIETAGLVAAVFAYGNVKAIIGNLENIFLAVKKRPADFIKEACIDKYQVFDGLYYRFNNDSDMRTLFWAIGRVFEKWGSLENLFLEVYKNEGFKQGLSNFSNVFRQLGGISPFENQKNYNYLFPSPENNSPCKRLCLYLRWMARKDEVDPGPWQGVDTRDLVIPLDAHITRLGRLLGLTRRKNPSWMMAREITDSLKRLSSDDPLKYDFPLCHLGISKKCEEKFVEEKCSGCSLAEACLAVSN